MIAWLRHRRTVVVLFLCSPIYGVPRLATASAMPVQRAAGRLTLPSCTVGGPADTVRSMRSVTIPSTPNPMWGRDTLRAVRARQVCVGMSEDMVRSAWGFPKTIEGTFGPNVKVVKFSYPDYDVVLEHDRVTSITPARADTRRSAGGA